MHICKSGSPSSLPRESLRGRLISVESDQVIADNTENLDLARTGVTTAIKRLKGPGRTNELVRIASARELTIASIEERLTASLSKPIRDEAKWAIHRVAELACSGTQWHQEMSEALLALKEILGPIHRWVFAKTVIGSAIGKNERTVQRLTSRPIKKKSARGELYQAENQTSDQSVLDIPESSVSSVTAVCLKKIAERAGRRFTLRPKPESDSAYTERILRETMMHFPSNSNSARRRGALHIWAQMQNLGISISEIETLNTKDQADR